MRKSSLGRRSSTNIPTRIPSLGASGSRLPVFNSNKRSKSEDRESYGGLSMASTTVRPSTAGMRNLGAMTPANSHQSLHANLPTGSARPTRNQTMSTDANRRMSSFGGAKNSRKDSRPISEKSYQQFAQSKVQQYLIDHCPNILGPDNSIRPMNTKLFVDLLDYLLKHFDNRIVITKSNYLEELPLTLRKFGYRSKIERSWLMTVNTPHSWQYVVAVLSWLVDVIECMNSVDEYEMMYPNNLSDQIEDRDNEDEDEDDLKFDKNLLFHLKRTYRFQNDPNVDQMDVEFVEKLIKDSGCTDEDIGILKREIDLIKGEIGNEEQIRDQELETRERLSAKRNAVLSDIQSSQQYIEESKTYIEKSQEKLLALNEDISNKRITLVKSQEELQKLKEKVSSQKISLDDKEKLMKEKNDLQRMIQFHENTIREYENSAFAVDMKSAENQRKFEKLVLEYNKLVAEKMNVEPRLKDVEVKFNLLNKADKEAMDEITCNLKSLKEEYKNSLRTLEAQKEERESLLWRIKQDIKETMEEIAKETALLEGVECDLEKQEELINKESQKLKEEAGRYQKMTKEIIDEIAQFDPAKLEEKKLECKKLEQDWELLQMKSKQLLDGELASSEEAWSIIKGPLQERNQKFTEFQKKHLQN